MVNSPPAGGQPPCPTRTTAFTGQEPLQTAAAGGQVATHLETTGEEYQALSGTSHIPKIPGAVLCKRTATSSAVPDNTRNTDLDKIQKPFLSWNRPHGRATHEKLRKHLLKFICKPAVPTRQPSQPTKVAHLGDALVTAPSWQPSTRLRRVSSRTSGHTNKVTLGKIPLVQNQGPNDFPCHGEIIILHSS